MAANTAPIFVKQGNLTPVRIITANSNNSGSTGTLYDVVTATIDGTRVDGIRFINAGTALVASAATRINIFNTVGATIRIVGQVLMPAATRSATVLGATAIYTFDQPIVLKTGEKISVTSTNWATTADDIDACAFAGDY
jgi:hypothetical protein